MHQHELHDTPVIQKFHQWYTDNLRGQPGKLIQHFHQFNSMTHLLFRNFVSGPLTICEDILANLFNIFVGSACGSVAAM